MARPASTRRERVRFDVVVPTIGRASLRALLASLARSAGPRPESVVIVDDRARRNVPLDLGPLDDDLRASVRVVTGRAAGPASARNAGWRASRAPWIAFVDDDVIVGDTWLADLTRDLGDAPGDVAASQGRITVPLPSDRRPTDWERNVAALAGARWITADCAYRRADLLAAGGFDERFRRAYREDADLALRVAARGRRIVTGTRRATHPVRPAPWHVSVRLQAGNADDALMRALHGAAWRERAGAPRGAFRAHLVTVAASATAAACALARRRRAAAVFAALSVATVARFAWRRIAPGPRTPREIAAMAATSAVVPFAAVAHRVRGIIALRALLRERARAPQPAPAAVLFDRDGTLVVDVPYNGDPARVQPVAGARDALARLRALGVPTAVVSNQSGIARGLISRADVDAVNARVEDLLGPLGPVFVCEHGPGDGCGCRKPAPGLIEEAARALGVATSQCIVVGDIGSDIGAAQAAGARAILVPTPRTRADEVAAAPVVARDIVHAVELALRAAS